MVMRTVSCKPASKCFGRHWEYFWFIHSQRNQDFSINFTTMWNFRNAVVFCGSLEFGEVCPFTFSMISVFLPSLTFQCLLKPGSLVNVSYKRRKETSSESISTEENSIAFWRERWVLLIPWKSHYSDLAAKVRKKPVIWFQIRPFLSCFLYN